MFKIIVSNQTLQIENENGVVIATKPLPYQVIPSPGLSALLEHEGNREALQEIERLVGLANERREA